MGFTFTKGHDWQTGQVITPRRLNGMIDDGSVSVGDLTVNTAMLANAAVTADALATNAVIEARLAEGSVAAPAFANGSATAVKLGPGVINAYYALAKPETDASTGASDWVSTGVRGFVRQEGAFVSMACGIGVTGSGVVHAAAGLLRRQLTQGNTTAAAGSTLSLSDWTVLQEHPVRMLGGSRASVQFHFVESFPYAKVTSFPFREAWYAIAIRIAEGSGSVWTDDLETTGATSILQIKESPPS